MEDWIRDLIAEGTRTLRAGLTAVQQRIAAIYGMFTAFFLRLRSRYSTWIVFVRNWKYWALTHALAVYTTMRWLTLVYIPRKIGDLSRSIVAWTRAEIAHAVAALLAEIAALRAWATKEVNRALAAVGALSAWTVREIGQMRADIARIKDRVFGVLATPERLAAWIVGAMAGALLRYVLAHAEALADYLWRRRTSLAVTSISLIERIVTRVL